MVPFRKCNENIQDFVLTSNMATQHQIQNIHLPGVPVDSPLQEFAVFSDSEDELEYVHEVHANLTNSIYTSKKHNVSIQCEIEKDVQLTDVLKFLSTCNFEKAKRIELDELMITLEWVSLKYNEIVKMSKTCSSPCKRKSPDIGSETNEVKHSSDITLIAHKPKKLKQLETSIEKENLPTLCEVTQISKEVNNLESLSPNKSPNKDSSKEIKTAQLKKKKDIGGKSNKANVKKQNKKGASLKTPSHTKQEENNLQSFSFNRDSSNKQIKTAQLKKKKDVVTKSIKATVDNQKKKSGSQNTTSNSSLKKSTSDNLFKHPLGNNKALARNWMHRSHSFNFEDTEKVKPHFASYQSDIKVRKLYSPSEWLNSEEFGKCSNI